MRLLAINNFQRQKISRAEPVVFCQKIGYKSFCQRVPIKKEKALAVLSSPLNPAGWLVESAPLLFQVYQGSRFPGNPVREAAGSPRRIPLTHVEVRQW